MCLRVCTSSCMMISFIRKAWVIPNGQSRSFYWSNETTTSVSPVQVSNFMSCLVPDSLAFPVVELPLNQGASLKIYVQHKTDGDAAELALQEIKNQIPSEQSLSLPVSASGLTVSQGLAELVQSLAKLIDIVDIFAEVGSAFCGFGTCGFLD